ncbi:MAG TPA: TRAP transporter large permease subunit [Hyphomicrobiaceae bacterium]|nr:TRAP transporter large permease subunit [Hyphomicrobiaceae bacterium]
MFGLGNPELGVLMLGLFVVFIMFGFPIAFTLMALGVFFGYFAMGDLVFSLVVQRTYSVMTNDVLISVPLFVFMGYVIERASILDRLFRSLQLAAGPVPASLALATLLTCAVFATATGIVGAVVTLMGLLAFPAMLRAGYDVKIAAGVVCAGGCLGILIPPSVMLILYGATAGVSVVKLYAGAFFPGIMLAALYMLYTVIMAALNPKLAPRLPIEERSVPLKTVLVALATSFLPLASLIFAALGSIMFGLATPSEAAAIGSLGALLLALFYGADYSKRWRFGLLVIYLLGIAAIVLYLFAVRFDEVVGLHLPYSNLPMVAFLALSAIVGIALVPRNSFDLAKLKESVFLTGRTTAMVCWLFIGSFTFSAVFAYLGGHGPIEKFVLSMNLSPLGFMILAQVIIFILGWPLEWTEIIVIFMPIFLPLLKLFEIDPLFFGLLVALNIQTSFLSPPVAMAPFYLKGVAPSWVNINDIFRGVMPYMMIVIICMAMLYTFPQIGLWLPNYLYK